MLELSDFLALLQACSPSCVPVNPPAKGEGLRKSIACGLCLCRGGADLFHALCLQTILRGEQRGGGEGRVKKWTTLEKGEKVITIINLSTKPG